MDLTLIVVFLFLHQKLRSGQAISESTVVLVPPCLSVNGEMPVNHQNLLRVMSGDLRVVLLDLKVGVTLEGGALGSSRESAGLQSSLLFLRSDQLAAAAGSTGTGKMGILDPDCLTCRVGCRVAFRSAFSQLTCSVRAAHH